MKTNVKYKKEIDIIFKRVFKGKNIDESKKMFFEKTNFDYENINSSIEGTLKNGFSMKLKLSYLTSTFKKVVEDIDNEINLIG